MIDVTDHGPVRLLRMNHPPANALGPEFLDALLDTLSRLESDAKVGGVGAEKSIGAAVLSGRPGMFSAGLDVPTLLRLDRDELAASWRQFYAVLRALAASSVPIVASITGHSPAGGAVLSLFCDHRVMAGGKFRIGLNEVRVGLALPEVILETLQHILGYHRAALLATSGSLVTAAEAHHLGLVDEVVEADGDAGDVATAVEERALTWARDLAGLPIRARNRTRALARQYLVRLVDSGLERDTEVLLDEWFSDETQGHLTALVERLSQKR